MLFKTIINKPLVKILPIEGTNIELFSTLEFKF